MKQRSNVLNRSDATSENAANNLATVRNITCPKSLNIRLVSSIILNRLTNTK